VTPKPANGQVAGPRATVSLPQSVMEDLFAIADENGRSLSNLLAFMIETKLQDYKQGKA